MSFFVIKSHAPTNNEKIKVIGEFLFPIVAFQRVSSLTTSNDEKNVMIQSYSLETN